MNRRTAGHTVAALVDVDPHVNHPACTALNECPDACYTDSRHVGFSFPGLVACQPQSRGVTETDMVFS